MSKDSSVRGIKVFLPESTPGSAGGTCVAEVFDEDVVKNLLEIDGVEGGGGSAPGPGEKPAMVKRLVSCFVEGVRSKKKKPQNPLADLSARKIISYSHNLNEVQYKIMLGACRRIRISSCVFSTTGIRDSDK